MVRIIEFVITVVYEIAQLKKTYFKLEYRLGIILISSYNPVSRINYQIIYYYKSYELWYSMAFLFNENGEIVSARKRIRNHSIWKKTDQILFPYTCHRNIYYYLRKKKKIKK